MYGPSCREICSLSCIYQKCTYEGYCRQCRIRTGGPYCFQGCVDWCGDYTEVNTFVSQIPNTTHRPPHQSTSFYVESFWFYVMLLIVIVSMCCFAAAGKPTKQAPNSAVFEIKRIDEIQG
ncbi:hypothetical protein Bpfe_013498 [Biomphalaria pfeifferi]|uniref:Uncharacterized protein n=1 Tax=Biomphalaria pfeifferi TaxID=112525 RepID=A0AAD8BM20_BIOPF|nr:hypothetical protein Bpfe_013498 [Biomphalaria pfeifferi]